MTTWRIETGGGSQYVRVAALRSCGKSKVILEIRSTNKLRLPEQSKGVVLDRNRCFVAHPEESVP